jgi:hypothetical protein
LLLLNAKKTETKIGVTAKKAKRLMDNTLRLASITVEKLSPFKMFSRHE